ncbi:hypothetical protein M2M59_09620 [Rummeliibacillus sp. G93]|uniref:hypothetical protein n=1 Tax=Rummeliibacillus sp. G93 TaxID=2939494 RepID=UPI00201BC199|nr:hypothetical protein [Rummeliibacillus sp. G93]UQW96271.1 hypothetical protein M2M59_09620 [Rummeliibacillus sp. G93]
MAWEDFNILDFFLLNGNEKKAKQYRQLSRALTNDKEKLESRMDDIEDSTDAYQQEHPSLKSEGFPANLYKTKQSLVDQKMLKLMEELKGEKKSYTSAINIANERAGHYQRLGEEEREREREREKRERERELEKQKK